MHLTVFYKLSSPSWSVICIWYLRIIADCTEHCSFLCFQECLHASNLGILLSNFLLIHLRTHATFIQEAKFGISFFFIMYSLLLQSIHGVLSTSISFLISTFISSMFCMWSTQRIVKCKKDGNWDKNLYEFPPHSFPFPLLVINILFSTTLISLSVLYLLRPHKVSSFTLIIASMLLGLRKAIDGVTWKIYSDD